MTEGNPTNAFELRCRLIQPTKNGEDIEKTKFLLFDSLLSFSAHLLCMGGASEWLKHSTKPQKSLIYQLTRLKPSKFPNQPRAVF